MSSLTRRAFATAVGLGVFSALVVEGTIYVGFGRLTILGGLAGSTVAGYLADGDDLTAGTLGFVVALGWAVVLLPPAVVLTLATDKVALVPFELLRPLFGSPLVIAVVALAVTVPNVLAGVVGGRVRRTQP